MASHGSVLVRVSMSILGLALCLATFAGRAEAWGPDGHQSICLLAEPLMEPATLKAVRSLLPESANGSLASLCLWADEIKRTPEYEWTYALHYVDTPDFLCRYNYDRDCHDELGTKDACASGAINNYTSQLTKFHLQGQSPRSPLTQIHQTEYNLTEALLLLAHIVGDIHQPLHIGFVSDQGGNTIQLQWYTSTAKLHHVWDDDILDRAKDLYYNKSLPTMVDAIMQNITNIWVEEAKLWGECPNGEIACPDTYATEGISIACQYAYKNATPGATLADEYFLTRLSIVETRLAQGGVRLAAILNRLFSGNSSSVASL